MKKLNLLKSLILVILVLTGTTKAFAYAETGQMLYTSSPVAVSVEPLIVNNSGTINPATGEISNTLNASFNLQTNDPDNYKFVMYSKIQTTGGEASAFDKDGNILFGNIDTLPTNTAVENAKTGNADNANVIGYKLNSAIGQNVSIIYDDTGSYGESYIMRLLNSVSSGSVEQTITGNPKVNTYSNSQDTSGTYRVTVYVTAIQNN
ncbi:hypothetical protein IJO12_04460 [bacterium]|nr:hypothetical protein [bacterium]